MLKVDEVVFREPVIVAQGVTERRLRAGARAPGVSYSVESIEYDNECGLIWVRLAGTDGLRAYPSAVVSVMVIQGGAIQKAHQEPTEAVQGASPGPDAPEPAPAETKRRKRG